MNKPSRTDDTLPHPTWNQSPPELAADLTTRQDLGILANLREQKRDAATPLALEHATRAAETPEESVDVVAPTAARRDGTGSGGGGQQPPPLPFLSRSWAILVKYSKFVGPGFMISVAYIDPGNYATDVAAGAQTRFALLFVVLMANIFAIYVQSLSIKLGSVTGLDLAENCRAHLPRWLTVCLYVLSEAAIIATDIAEVIGTAIALNLLLRVPLVAGAVISLVDVFVILLFYRPDGAMPAVRAFELFVAAIVLGVVVLFCVELSLIRDSVADVFRGYLPSAAVVENNGLYLSCGILGATVMPHSIFLGSGVVQSRLRHFDVKNGLTPAPDAGSDDDDGSSIKYKPSAAAIRHCLRYSMFELGFSLFTFALFVNSAILIVAGAALYGNTEATDADLFGIHSLLSNSIAPVAGTVFALALLLSGISAGIVCTMAGQMVSEGMLNWRLKPWLRRLLTRAISIVPSVVVAAAIGKEGLNAALAASQVVLSAILPFVTAPLIYFTARNRYMTVAASGDGDRAIGMRNHWVVTAIGFLVWLVIAVMNVALLVLVGMGKM